MFDLVIKNADIVDGTGCPRRRGTIAVRDGIINIVEHEPEAVRTIDGTGLILAPGFIDVHSHGDLVAGHDYARLCKTSQGITTEVAGQCGSSFFPVTEASRKIVLSNAILVGDLEREHMGEFKGIEGYKRFLEKQKLSANMMGFMGHSTLRMAVMGTSDAKPDSDQMERMKVLLADAMEHGCAGLSTGLFYPPSGYADVDEISELVSVVAEYGGIHTTHMRNEGFDILTSVDEVLEVSRRTGAALNISHHKVCGRKNWGLSEQTLGAVDAARKDGLSVTLDVYPYTASMTKLAACIPTEYFVRGTEWLSEALKEKKLRREIREKMETYEDGRYLQCGGFSGVMVGKCLTRPEAEGKRISDYAKELGQDAFEVFFDLIVENGAKCTAIYFSMGDEDLERIVTAPYAMIGTDGLVAGIEGKTHPRGWASFPRAIRLFVREKKLLSLEEMIHKMTGLPAETYHMTGKGRIMDGADADLVLFEEDSIGDAADFVHSNRLCTGIRMVINRGRIVYEDGTMTGEYPGKWIDFRR